jgi:hypothetical protein
LTRINIYCTFVHTQTESMAKKKKQLRADIDEDLHTKLKAKVATEKTTIHSKITELLTSYIK